MKDFLNEKLCFLKFSWAQSRNIGGFWRDYLEYFSVVFCSRVVWVWATSHRSSFNINTEQRGWSFTYIPFVGDPFAHWWWSKGKHTALLWLHSHCIPQSDSIPLGVYLLFNMRKWKTRHTNTIFTSSMFCFAQTLHKLLLAMNSAAPSWNPQPWGSGAGVGRWPWHADQDL